MNFNKVIQTLVFIGRENMLEYLSTDFIFPRSEMCRLKRKLKENCELQETSNLSGEIL